MTATARTLQGRPRLTARAAVLLLSVAVLCVAALVPAREYLAQRAELSRLDRQAAELERATQALRTRIARLGDPVVLEELARACLGMVDPGEIALVMPPGSAPRVRC
ncbi:MAG TPA: septum formation initiator family protein [Actinomycetota bacterium]|nr:septum formation initiator family protein [Actinomycetota bacterium]